MDDGLDVTLLEQGRLKRYWPIFREGLHQICQRQPQRWIPEDIYTALRVKSAEALLIKKHERLIGFVVGMPTVVLYTGEAQYFVWAIWRAPRATVTRFNRMQVLKAIQARAKQFNATEITYASNRKGFARYGAVEDYTYYRMPLN